MPNQLTLRPALMLLLAVAAPGIFGSAAGQQRTDRAAALFDRAAGGFVRAADDLRRERSLRPLLRAGVTSSDIVQALGATTDAGERVYPEGSAVLFYTHDGGYLRVWLLTETGVPAYAVRRISAVQLSAAIARLRNALDLTDRQNARTPRLLVQTGAPQPPRRRIPLEPAIRELSAVLFPPALSRAVGSARHLIVVPSLGIGTVPFALLRPFGTNEMLIDRMSVTIAPDLFDLTRPVDRWEARFRSPLVIGDPYLPPDPRWDVPPLPGAAREAAQLGRLLGIEPLLGKGATKQEVLARIGAADGLFFAAHGVANAADPLAGSFLALSAGDFRGGWWTAREVQSTPLRAKLAVLSACQTGLGQSHDAGIIGLARAFHLAGVPRVVMSLWSVNDAASDELMQAFMRHLLTAEQPPPAEALRRAMVERKQNEPDPSKWAAFMVFGTPR